LQQFNVSLGIVPAPLQPRNLSLGILTPNHENERVRNVNVTISWQPPIHTHNGTDVKKYIVTYIKVPPMNVAKQIRPHRGGYDNISVSWCDLIKLDSSPTVILIIYNSIWSFLIHLIRVRFKFCRTVHYSFAHVVVFAD